MPFINKQDYSGDLSIFIVSSISSFEIINAVVPDPQFFFRTDVSVADAAVVNPNGIKTIFANDLSAFFINGKPPVINGLKN